MSYKCLSNDQKVVLIRFFDKLGPKWTLISKLTLIPESTIISFIKRYLNIPKLELKRGRPPSISDQTKTAIIQAYEENPEASLKQSSKIFEISPSKVKEILNEGKIFQMKKIAVPESTALHRQNRVIFSNYICSFNPSNQTKINHNR